MSDDPTATLLTALVEEDSTIRTEKSLTALDAGADARAESYGHNTLSLLLSGHKYVEAGDYDVFKHLVKGGTDVNHRNKQGHLILRLLTSLRAGSDEERRPFYETLFGTGKVDLSLPSNGNNPVNTLKEWLEMNIEKRQGKLDVLAEFVNKNN